MRLRDLVRTDVDGEVTGITADSRAVRPGMIFAALRGTNVDGAAFVPDALAAGALAILCAPDAAVDAPIVVRDADPRRRLALMAAALAGAQPAVTVAVTGTAGKTSVAEFTRQISAAAGHTAVSVGTLGISGAVTVPGGLTTPDPVALHARLADLAGAGVTHLAMEASSHGIAQRRLDGVRLTAAAFTNIGRDHLDYHPTPEAYLAAKLRLFETLLPPGAPTVVDPESPGGEAVLAVAGTAFTVGRGGRDLHLSRVRPMPGGARLTLRGAGEHTVELPLIGAFQADNAVLAAGLAMAAGVAEDVAVGALASLKGAPGRLERVGDKAGAPVFVDYAHKPDAVEAALAAVRPAVAGPLIVVIGAGGDRDPGKRPLMGAASAKYADTVIVTDDNPRSENPAAIRKAVMEGAPDAIEIGDRREAIAHAIARLAPNGALVIAGKGHEEGQTAGGVTTPFNDRTVAMEVLAAL
ncbi:MAG: UDP-N-acetylmuramoyl-L-alanyl-D-glutamate--2,6-diaminopimelate ligase [Pseudomonadota bacterium]